jgi:hypothetical protein
MLEAALGGMTPHEALLEASRNESADVGARRSHREESRAGPEAAGRTREIAGLNTRAVVPKREPSLPFSFGAYLPHDTGRSRVECLPGVDECTDGA